MKHMDEKPLARAGRLGRGVALAGALSWCAATGCSDGPSPDSSDVAPDSFLVALETSQGELRIGFHRDWSPMAVDRVWQLAQANHWAGGRIYRVNPRYVQFGYTGRPTVDSAWVGNAIPDEPVMQSNVRGTVSFARGGPDTRSVILFINRGDNSDLDDLEWRGVLGFPPVGRVEVGMEVLDALNGAYGDEPLNWEDSIAALGNSFFDRSYPGLDSILRVRIIEDWR